MLTQICTLTGLNMLCNYGDDNKAMRYAHHIAQFGYSFATKEEYDYRFQLFSEVDDYIN